MIGCTSCAEEGLKGVRGRETCIDTSCPFGKTNITACRCGHQQREHSCAGIIDYSELTNSTCYGENGEDFCECIVYRPATPEEIEAKLQAVVIEEVKVEEVEAEIEEIPVEVTKPFVEPIEETIADEIDIVVPTPKEVMIEPQVVVKPVEKAKPDDKDISVAFVFLIAMGVCAGFLLARIIESLFYLLIK